MFVKIILHFAKTSTCLLKYEYEILKDGSYRSEIDILIFYWKLWPKE